MDAVPVHQYSSKRDEKQATMPKMLEMRNNAGRFQRSGGGRATSRNSQCSTNQPKELKTTVSKGISLCRIKKK